ncbi:hypothetical protein TrLO_g566 [Triparma laevis f. longispina]|uniref:Uncharacterized protein n=1 Tax=Triparma laevis f. longispina TaxID=1714387 RepID=A0A9W7A9D5_9STRA|nr:hypothetical protein TrLO_g566 [Triparma laevis f. longispina]
MGLIEWGPSFEESQANNFTCNQDLNEYLNPCPPLLQCYYDEALGDVDGVSSCHCGTIGRFSNDFFPDCAHHGDMTWLPILIGTCSTCTAFYALGWGIWVVNTLKKLDQLHFNDITKALFFTMGGHLFLGVHQFCETMQILMMDVTFHPILYGAPGISQLCLSGMGCCCVLSDLNIPLLWIQIASASMSKVDAERRKKQVARIVKFSAIFFGVTFLGIVSVMGTGIAGMYTLLWIIAIFVVFNVGGRKLRSQLRKEGEEDPKAVKDIMRYVNRLSFGLSCYVGCIVWFFPTSRPADANPANWQIPASLIYFWLVQCCLMNIMYIRSTLDKKLGKFKKNGGVVVPSSMATSTATTTEMSQ